MEKLTGSIKHYVYKNETNGYTIAKIELEDQSRHTIVGYFPALSEDVVYDFFGEWIKHSQYGTQFKVESFTKSTEQSLTGLVSYLSSAFFKGIGPKTAQRIVDALGDRAIERIITDYTILKDVGLSLEKAKTLHDELVENQATEHLLVVLYGYQLSGKMAMKLIQYYQERTLQVLQDNPYQLVEDIEGIGFIKADEIAQKVGISLNDPRRVEAAILYALKHIAYQNGDLYLTEEQLKTHTVHVLGLEAPIDEVLQKLIQIGSIILEDKKYYLKLSYETEKSVAEHSVRLSNGQLSTIDTTYIDTLLLQAEIDRQIHYTDEQKEAIKEAFSSPMFIITGGPGTGKTTIIDGILEVYKNYYGLKGTKQDLAEKIALMAPTGRAAKRMKELLDFDAKTIHRHLGYGFDGFFTYDEFSPLPHKLIIIDEASMIDIFLAKRLFSAIKTGTQVIIVGDVDQLPSVGPGQVLYDLIESKTIPTKRLTHIHRQAKDSYIIKLAQKINVKQIAPDDLYSGQDVYFYRCYYQQVKEIILNQLDGALSKGYDMINDIQVLIPMYKGDVGIDMINEAIQERFNKNRNIQMEYLNRKYYVGDKVIQLTNDPERQVMNGDIGVVKRIAYNEDKELYMTVQFLDVDATYTKQDLEDLNLAYAMSIHKSQGSEYKIVMIPLVKNYMHMLKKELIYTAVTRAKQYLIFLGDVSLLVYASNHLSEHRQSSLKEMMIHIKGDAHDYRNS